MCVAQRDIIIRVVARTCDCVGMVMHARLRLIACVCVCEHVALACRRASWFRATPRATRGHVASTSPISRRPATWRLPAGSTAMT